MKDLLLVATAVGIAYIIYNQSKKERKCNCEKCAEKEGKPSEKLTDDMKVYAMKRKANLIPDAIYKDYETDTGATVSKNRMRYKFKKMPNDLLTTDKI